MNETDSFDHLFQSDSGQALAGLRKDFPTLKKKPKATRFFEELYDYCMAEVFYVAGQLRVQNSPLTLDRLMDEFEVYWDHFAEQLSDDRRP